MYSKFEAFLLFFITCYVNDGQYHSYIQEWVVSNAVLPHGDTFLAAGYDEINAQIHIFGGEYFPQNEYIFDVNKNSILSTNQLTLSSSAGGSQFYVEINNKLNQSSVYFSNLNVSSSKNFYRFNISVSNTVIEQMGQKYPKPNPTIEECYTTDMTNRYVYLIGGANHVAVNTFQIFDTFTNKWSQGPPLNNAKDSMACMYYMDENDGNEYLYAFGGCNSVKIEILVINGNDKWTVIGSLTETICEAYAFYPQPNTNSAHIDNIVFIIFSEMVVACEQCLVV
eukprot:339446_1